MESGGTFGCLLEKFEWTLGRYLLIIEMQTGLI